MVLGVWEPSKTSEGAGTAEAERAREATKARAIRENLRVQ